MSQASVSHIPIVAYVKEVAKDQDNQIVKQICLLFTPTLEGYKNTIVPKPQDLKEPAFVLHAVMQRPLEELSHAEKKLLDQDIVDLVLMASASHPDRLTDSQKESMQIIGGSRLSTYKKRAVTEGCSEENPSLFFIHHAYCALMGSEKALVERSKLPKRPLSPQIIHQEAGL